MGGRPWLHLTRFRTPLLCGAQLFVEWIARFLLLSKQDMTRIIFRAFDSSKRGDMTRGDFIYMVEVLHPALSAPKRTQMVNVAGKLLALKADTLGEAFKMKDVRDVGLLSTRVCMSVLFSLQLFCCGVRSACACVCRLPVPHHEQQVPVPVLPVVPNPNGPPAHPLWRKVLEGRPRTHRPHAVQTRQHVRACRVRRVCGQVTKY